MVSEIKAVSIPAQPAKCQVIGQRAYGVTVDGRMGHVHALAAGRVYEFPAQGFPGKVRAGLVIVQQMRRQGQ